MKRRAIAAIAISVLFATTTFAQLPPAKNVSPAMHSNLAAAQKFIDQAFQKIAAAQVVNGGQLGGHAQKAKELLEQASAELKLAAETANSKSK